MERASPAQLGIAASTFANHRSGVRYVFRRLGLLAPQRRRTPAVVAAPWAPLLAKLPAQMDFKRLRAFVAFCAAEGIAPNEVGHDTLDAYAASRTAEAGGSKGQDKARRARVQWNTAVDHVPEWPRQRLGLRERPSHRSPPFTAYPASLQAEIKAYLAAIGGAGDGGLFSGTGRPAVRPSTVETRRYSLRRLLHGAVQGGVAIADRTRLRDVTSPAFIRAALSWHHQRSGGEIGADLAQLAATIASVANHLALPSEEMTEVKRLLRHVKVPPRREISEDKARLLAELDDPRRRARLLHLPQLLMQEAERLRSGVRERAGPARQARPVEAAWLAATAAAVEILLHAPMRLANLTRLRIGQELRLVSLRRGRWSGTLFVAAGDVKNGRRIEVPLGEEPIRLLRRYLDVHRPELPNAAQGWLFPGQASPDEPRHKGAFGQAITEAILQHVGVRMTPHAFRCFAGALILEDDPHAIDDVRALLGHETFETALIYYRRHDQRAAAERLSATLSRSRQASALRARAGMVALGLRRRRKGAP